MQTLGIMEIFQAGESVIQDIEKNGITLMNHRELINKKTQLLLAIQETRKNISDAWLQLKADENKRVQELMDEGAKKSPAKEAVAEETREARYELNKREIDVETMMDIAKNRTYHLRVGEIDLNKVGVGTDQI